MSNPDFRSSLHGTPYSETIAAKAPVKINTASDRAAKQTSQHGSTFHDQVTTKNLTITEDNVPSQNGPDRTRLSESTFLTRPKTLSVHDSQTSLNTTDQPPSSITSAPSIPQIRVDPDPEQTSPNTEQGEKKWLSIRPTRSRTKSQKKDAFNTPQSFQGLALDLPAGSLGEDLSTKNMKFSNRGSVFLDGRKVSPSPSMPSTTLQRPTEPMQRSVTSSSAPERTPTRIMSTDEEMLSEKVRLYYAYGSDAVQGTDVQNDMANKMGTSWRDHLNAEAESLRTTSKAPSTNEATSRYSPSLGPTKGDHIEREEMELAGGLEDWQDVDSADVDRYGFIIPKSPTTRNDLSGLNRSPTVRGQGLQRVSTSLQLASETPRRKRTIRRSSAEMTNRAVSDSLAHTTSNQTMARPSSSKSATAGRTSAFRAASNRLPGHRERRLMDEASDMLTLPQSLTAEPLQRTLTMTSDRSVKSKTTPESKSTSASARKKELEREEKWRKMARPTPSTTKTPDHKGIGGGMLFTFPPTTDAKLISRTWKGIPDTWRAPAWHYFLSVSARKNPHSLPDDKLINLFYEYQDTNCPDDVQIDIDVPRTISSHIMFRRRYRGGQRLLFRVLHAMSLHWPDTGYVQGMAALAATLLSYYEEEKAFVMLVRLWECRGLEKLYREGFGGLMEALDDFERGWLGNGEVAKKLHDLNIFPTAYGTKWYLTLFNYSIPFPAQLRVWDVFMLLGDDNITAPSTQTHPDPPFGSILDVLHATSAALIDGMRDILLESDFENAMKVLTSWIPIRDEDLFMRVSRAEFKMFRERQRRL